MNYWLTGNTDCSYFSTWIRNQSSPEHRTNPSGNWNVPSVVRKKSTLVWMPDRQTYKFFCSKSNRLACGSACEFPVLLKIWNQPLWMAYLGEREEEGTAGAGWNVPKASLMNQTPRPRKKRGCRNRQVPNQPRNGSAPGAGRSC